jgi:hypothetical protein
MQFMKYLSLTCLVSVAWIFVGCAGDPPATTSTTTEESSVVQQPAENTTTQTTVQKSN